MSRPRRVVLMFLDGVGIGTNHPEVNPFFAARLPNLERLLGGRMFHRGLKRITASRAVLGPVNATLGVPGFPQSGTGQTAIFTGVNAPRRIGKHFGPYPPTALRPVIGEESILAVLGKAGKRVVFANAFPRQFFEYTDSGTRRLTVTTLACMMAGIPLQTADALRENRAISADITRARWPEMGYPDLTEIGAEEAGRHLADLAREHEFTLFEYWLTDHAGHSMDMTFAVDVLERFDAFLGGYEDAAPEDAVTILISDHGNIEDLSVKTHTRNPVPCMVMGVGKKEILAGISNLTHLTPSILRILL